MWSSLCCIIIKVLSKLVCLHLNLTELSEVTVVTLTGMHNIACVFGKVAPTESQQYYMYFVLVAPMEDSC